MAAFPVDGRTAVALLHLADERMYQSKRDRKLAPHGHGKGVEFAGIAERDGGDIAFTREQDALGHGIVE